jgi:Ca2+-binding RTX toxin-like protein
MARIGFRISDWFTANDRQLSRAEFADGAQWSQSQLSTWATAAGTLGNDTLVGTEQADVLRGWAGNDSLNGLAGDDQLFGGDGDDQLLGGAGQDQLDGGSGHDSLDGGTGNDRMVGGAGNDMYWVDSVGDQVIEGAGEGTDQVNSLISYTLGADMENLTLLETVAIDGTGNAGDNVIIGNSARNIITGGAGQDYLDGGAGDDLYMIRAGSDHAAGGEIHDASGYNQVRFSSAFAQDTLVLGAGDTGINDVSITATTGSATVLTYNDLNVDATALRNGLNINGNAGNNRLIGTAFNDYINGGLGNDVMIGGDGNDSYIVDSAGDVVIETADQGFDSVNSSVSYTLGANVEDLFLKGTAAIDGTGNVANNRIYGNAARNVMDGSAGNDTLVGGGGNDTYVFGRGYGVDTVIESDVTAGNTDQALFFGGINFDQLWFSRNGSNLDLSIIGTTDKLRFQDWYVDQSKHVEVFKTSNGQTLVDSQVQNLVNAMAAFAPPAAGQLTLPDNYHNALDSVLAANWQS